MFKINEEELVSVTGGSELEYLNTEDDVRQRPTEEDIMLHDSTFNQEMKSLSEELAKGSPFVLEFVTIDNGGKS